jgi:hypothetical protein
VVSGIKGRDYGEPPRSSFVPTKRTERRDGDVTVKNYVIDSQFFFYFSYSSFRELDSGRRSRMINGARGPKSSSWLLLLLVRVGQKKCMKAE